MDWILIASSRVQCSGQAPSPVECQLRLVLCPTRVGPDEPGSGGMTITEDITVAAREDQGNTMLRQFHILFGLVGRAVGRMELWVPSDRLA